MTGVQTCALPICFPVTIGGMAGGSADAAGVIVCLDSLFDLGLSRDVMESIGSQIGADVPFSISGGVAIGTGRGDQITPALYKGN